MGPAIVILSGFGCVTHLYHIALCSSVFIVHNLFSASATSIYIMSKNEASDFISGAGLQNQNPQLWADMGCGSGLFSFALAQMLCSGSTIYAVDKTNSFSRTNRIEGIKTELIQADFVHDALGFKQLNGILIANSLHYVADKNALLHTFKTMLLPQGIFIVVEYDTVQPNRWLPYPVSFFQLKQLFLTAGYTNTRKIGERKSVYNNTTMYAAIASS